MVDDPYDPRLAGLATQEEAPIQLAQATGIPPPAAAVPAPAGVPPPATAVPAPATAVAPAGLAAAPAAPQLTQEQAQQQMMMNFFRDPKRLAMAATLAAKHNQPDVLKWLQMGHAAQKENTGEGLAKLAAGDTEGAMAAFNMNGDQKITKIEPGKTEGTYSLSFNDGKTREVNPKRSLMALLTPPQMFAVWDREEATKARSDAASERTQLMGVINEGKQETARARTEREQALSEARIARDLGAAAASRARAGLSEAQTEHVGDPKGVVRTITPNVYASRLDASARHYNSTTDAMGKSVTDGPMAADTAAMGRVIAEKSLAEGKELAPEIAAQMGKTAVDDIRQKTNDEIDAKIAKAKKDAGIFTRDSTAVQDALGGKKEKDYRASEIKKAMDKAIKDAQASIPAAGPKVTGAAKATSAAAATPATEEQAKAAAGANYDPNYDYFIVGDRVKRRRKAQ